MREYAKALNIGAVRASNQDQVILASKDQIELMLVCDGMGGANAGDVASKMCVDSVYAQFMSDEIASDLKSLKEWMIKALRQANMDVLQASMDHPNYYGMGTTAVLALCSKNYKIIANVGDSRAYGMNDQLFQISSDHSLVNQWILDGKMSVEEAKHHPQRSVLTNVLGVSKDMKIDVFECESDLKTILLCSDGVSGMLEDSQIEALILKGGSANSIVKRIEKAALSLGGYDNIACAIMIEDKS